MANQAIYCRLAHVFVNETEIDFDAITAGCQPFTLTGAVVDTGNDFVVYDPPACPFVVDSTTSIKVCFWASHTYVSDLGFYLVAPDGSRVDLQPPVPVWNQGPQVTNLNISVVTGCNPNPFTNVTEISFYLPKECVVEFEIFDLMGKRVPTVHNIQTLHAQTLRATSLPSGRHTLTFTPNTLPSGTYFYRLKTPEYEQTKKMVLNK